MTGEAERRRTEARFKQLEAGLRLRMGEVTVVSPLTITLGGPGSIASEIGTYQPRRLSAGSYSVGDQVAVLTWGNDMLVLGTIA